MADAQANLGTPISVPQQVVQNVSATKVLVAAFSVSRDSASAAVEVDYQSAGDVSLRRASFAIPADQANPGTELASFLTALGTARATETGVPGRRINFRILGYLSDAGRLPGVTLVP